MGKPKIVIALGGNSLINADYLKQLSALKNNLAAIVDIVRDYQVIITHGNGPQVGEDLIRQEEAKQLDPLPLFALNANTQGRIGYQIQSVLSNLLRKRGINTHIIVLTTRVLVDRNDKAFQDPTKFVGPAYEKTEAEQLAAERGWVVKEDKGRGYRRVVASPLPLDILEREAIKELIADEYIVVCAGGGGIPVYKEYIAKEMGDMVNFVYKGIDAVIDKDFASALLANEIGAKEFLILTEVKKVCLNFGTPEEKSLHRLTLNEAEEYIAQGQFPAGSMGPKVQAALNFLKGGGEKVYIGSVSQAAEILTAEAGTIITN